ncbi:hypothetical protein [Sinorhizobium meliloti]|uniref:hypothetical protein n=1 Tax=Rhizobium meliloti TaxID=382 RepID=UPI001295A3F8|nr:hypothetical protein [Sinorhizobium meliloti]MDW9491721.1 hypothetical protein [Sinorhizobium meliloti]MQV02987.1 hypothetical protein [Sinorhizobium meliloti]
MAKKTYIVTDPSGKQHTRKTDRVYTHAVVVRDSYEFDLAEASKIYDVDKQNFEYSVKIVNTNGEYLAQTIYPSYTPEQVANVEQAKAQRLAKAQEEVNTFKTAQAFAEDRRAKRIAKVEERRAAGCYKLYDVLGFNGRLDLAQKAASAAQGGRYAEVHILSAKLKG